MSDQRGQPDFDRGEAKAPRPDVLALARSLAASPPDELTADDLQDWADEEPGPELASWSPEPPATAAAGIDTDAARLVVPTPPPPTASAAATYAESVDIDRLGQVLAQTTAENAWIARDDGGEPADRAVIAGDFMRVPETPSESPWAEPSWAYGVEAPPSVETTPKFDTSLPEPQVATDRPAPRLEDAAVVNDVVGFVQGVARLAPDHDKILNGAAGQARRFPLVRIGVDVVDPYAPAADYDPQLATERLQTVVSYLEFVGVRVVKAEQADVVIGESRAYVYIAEA